jgi:hypothetical protein
MFSVVEHAVNKNFHHDHEEILAIFRFQNYRLLAICVEKYTWSALSRLHEPQPALVLQKPAFLKPFLKF